jgi:capsular exopolysaccharide synthesis family protein
VQEELGLPLLGQVSDDALGRSIAAGKGRKGSKGLDHRDLEAARIVRTSLQFMRPDERSFRSVAVTSAVPEEGKTTVAASLAYAASLSGSRAVLIECDLRRPVLAKRLGLADRPGIGDAVLGRVSLQEAIQEVPIPAAGGSVNGDGTVHPAGGTTGAFHCIVAGTPTPQPAELLESKRFAELFEEVRDLYDLVVVDTAPLLAVVDTLQVIPHVDRLVLCVRRGKTTREQAAAARATLERLPDRPAGLVVTGIRGRDEAYYGGYGYGY